MGISEVAHVCDDHVTVYKHSAFRPLHRTTKLTLHQPNSTDVVITKPGALGSWSHSNRCRRYSHRGRRGRRDRRSRHGRLKPS